jgi:hypothetical protein
MIEVKILKFDASIKNELIQAIWRESLAEAKATVDALPGSLGERANAFLLLIHGLPSLIYEAKVVT